MGKILFDRNLLLSVAKQNQESKAPIPQGGNAHPLDQYALAVVSPGDDLSGLISTLYTLNANARILEITAPEGKDNLKQYRAMQSELSMACGEPPLRHGQENALAARLPKLLSDHFDDLIVLHAERMGTYSLDLLRRDRGNPTVLLIAYDDRVLNTVLSNDGLTRRVVLLT